MAKKKNKVLEKEQTDKKTEIPVDTQQDSNHWFPTWLSGFRIQAMIVSILAISFYVNTVQNEYALDDNITIIQNEYVYEGLAGLGDIFTKDTYDSYWRQLNTTNSLSGGRYRPLSVAIFAIEQQFFGAVPKAKADSIMQHVTWGELHAHQQNKLLNNMHIRHLLNVIGFTLAAIVLLWFLRYVVFKKNAFMAFIATVVFVIHPIHTEVVANVKSSDEILSLMFICLTFIFSFKYEEQKEKKWFLFAGVLSCFLAFLSKEYAIGLVILLPLLFFLFKNYSLSKSIVASLPYMGVMALYLVMRSQIVTPPNPNANVDVVNDPYAFASATEKIATEIATPLNYLKLLVFPHPLSADYSYNAIPYKDFTSLLVWLSITVHVALLWTLFYYLKRRNVLSFAIAFYLVNLALICNLVFNIGATMGERLIYHSSVGFSIAIAYLLVTGMEKIKPTMAGRIVFAGCAMILIALCGFKTIDRNTNWKNDAALFTHDLKVVPNSVLANSNVAAYFISESDLEKNGKLKDEDLRHGINLLDKVISLNKNNATTYFNKCVAYLRLKETDSVLVTLSNLRSIYPSYPDIPQMYYEAGLQYISTKQYAKAKLIFQALLKTFPQRVEVQNALKIVNDSMQTH